MSEQIATAPVAAKVDEKELAASLLGDEAKIGEAVRGGTSQFVDLARLPWIEVLKKARPGMDVLKVRVAELLEAALKASASTVAVDRKNAAVVCRLAGV